MTTKSSLLGALSFLGLIVLISLATAEEREWTDRSGKNKLTAELVSADDDKVVLRNSAGKEITVRLDQLSKQDQAFIRDHQPGTDTPSLDSEAASEELRAAAVSFFEGLHGSDRTAAKDLLTADAQEVAKNSKSPLAQLPEPGPGKKSIRPGKARRHRR